MPIDLGGGLIAGHGSSAHDAQHLTIEFLSRFASDRRPLPAIALTTDTSALTAIANDYGFEHVFERPILALGATARRVPGYRLRALCDLCLAVSSTETAIIQQIHILAGHAICGLVEQAVVTQKPSR